MAIVIEHTVKEGETLRRIAKIYARDLGLDPENASDVDKLVGQIAYLNSIDNIDLIKADSTLLIPKSAQLPKETRKTKPSPVNTKQIRIGSIIHLESDALDGGYLDILKKVEDEPAIDMFHDPSVRAFVATYDYQSNDTNNQQLNRSTSWQILSADGAKQIGEPLVVGDRIHLLNMEPECGYLDSFEWVDRIKPFQEYPMQIGVFASGPKRGRDVSGTWTIQPGADKVVGETVKADDIIRLENAYPGAGLLHTYGKVTEHPLFAQEKYHGYGFFVFTGPKPGTDASVLEKRGSPRWKISVNARTKNLYRLFQRSSKKQIPLHDDIFEIGERFSQPVTALKLRLTDTDKPLVGRVAYGGEALPAQHNFMALYQEQNVYAIYIAQGNKTLSDIDPDNQMPDDQWQLGSREHQRIAALDVTIDDRGSLSGTVTYQGEEPVQILLLQEIALPTDAGSSLFGGRSPEWIRARTSRMERLVVSTHHRLSEIIQTMTARSQDPILQSPRIKGTQGLSDSFDYEFLIEQLQTLDLLKCRLNTFFRYTLYPLMKQSLEEHQSARDETLAPLHLFRQCFQHVEMDHRILAEAINQRGEAEDALELLKLDKLAIKAIAPFQKLLSEGTGDNAVDIITYLSEKTHIHLVPYTQRVILIGVSHDRVPPAASIFENEELLGKEFYAYEIMAIPHEIGHYIYQHGKLSGQTFSQLSRKFENHPYYQWCEEIFADVYGCIVGGPLAAISMQALLMSIDRERAWKDDEDHPTPVLRVFIFAEILRILRQVEVELDDEAEAIRYDFHHVTEQLEQDWTKILKLWRYDAMDNSPQQGAQSLRPSRVYMHDSSALHLESIVNVDRVIKAMRPIIIEYATALYRFARDEVSFGRTQVEDEHQLSLEFPWAREDRTSTEPYNDVMARMTDTAFARKKVSRESIKTPAIDEGDFDLSAPDEKLLRHLKEWSDRGPFGSGTGTYSLFSFYG